QDKLFLETRRFLTGSQIFPRFSAKATQVKQDHYVIAFGFERAVEMGFVEPLTVEIRLKATDGVATELQVRVVAKEPIFEGSWVEVLTVDAAASIVQGALLSAVDRLVPQA